MESLRYCSLVEIRALGMRKVAAFHGGQCDHLSHHYNAGAPGIVLFRAVDMMSLQNALFRIIFA
jgi:hypothetical protein